VQTIDELRNLLAYNEWANRRVIGSLKASPDPPAKALRALSHLLVAEQAWMKRLRENLDSTGFDFWPAGSVDACETLAAEVSRSYGDFLGDLSEDRLGSFARYKNSKGTEFETSYRDVLTHVMLHSAYHRGQVATALREAGREPAQTDYIVFVRERSS
jgi:uncharacterized damage-inducible protein DinB